jgi:DNA-binding PadR family transcriptional regulator
MTSAVNWTLLGLVIERPSYGWELASRFQRVYSEVLPVSGDSHLYSALDALAGRGLIEIVPGTEFGRQPKPHYRATAVGLEAYEDWLVMQVDAEGRRQELWVRQLAIFARNPHAALRVIARYQAEYLKRAGRVGTPTGHATANSPAALIDELVSEQRRISVGGMLSWLNFAQARFEAIVGGEPPEDRARA